MNLFKQKKLKKKLAKVTTDTGITHFNKPTSHIKGEVVLQNRMLDVAAKICADYMGVNCPTEAVDQLKLLSTEEAYYSRALSYTNFVCFFTIHIERKYFSEIHDVLSNCTKLTTIIHDFPTTDEAFYNFHLLIGGPITGYYFLLDNLAEFGKKNILLDAIIDCLYKTYASLFIPYIKHRIMDQEKFVNNFLENQNTKKINSQLPKPIIVDHSTVIVSYDKLGSLDHLGGIFDYRELLRFYKIVVLMNGRYQIFSLTDNDAIIEEAYKVYVATILKSDEESIAKFLVAKYMASEMGDYSDIDEVLEETIEE